MLHFDLRLLFSLNRLFPLNLGLFLFVCLRYVSRSQSVICVLRRCSIQQKLYVVFIIKNTLGMNLLRVRIKVPVR